MVSIFAKILPSIIFHVSILRREEILKFLTSKLGKKVSVARFLLNCIFPQQNKPVLNRAASNKTNENQQKESLDEKLDLKNLQKLYPKINITDYNLGYNSNNSFMGLSNFRRRFVFPVSPRFLWGSVTIFAPWHNWPHNLLRTVLALLTHTAPHNIIYEI